MMEIKIKIRLDWLRAEIKTLKKIEGYSAMAESFVSGKIFAYEEEIIYLEKAT